MSEEEILEAITEQDFSGPLMGLDGAVKVSPVKLAAFLAKHLPELP